MSANTMLEAIRDKMDRQAIVRHGGPSRSPLVQRIAESSCLHACVQRIAKLEEQMALILAEKETSSPLAITIIKQIVSREMSVSVSEMESPSRQSDLTWARFIAMWLMRQHTKFSLIRIGRTFCREHGSVINALEGIVARSETEPHFAKELVRLDTLVREAIAKI